jgi:Secretion system C-terminal sorting domain
MKKLILILYATLLCSLGWAQDNSLADAARSKAQNSPGSARAPEEEAKQQVLLYPNPSNGIVHLTLAGFKSKKTELRIMNVIGNVVYREILSEPDDRFTKTIDLTRYANGLYYVKLQAEDFSQIRKIIIH